MILLKRRALEGLRYARIALVAAPLLTAVGIIVPYRYAGHTVALIPRMFAVKVPDGVTLVELAASHAASAGSGTKLWVGASELRYAGAVMGPSSNLDSDKGCEEVASRLKAGMTSYDVLEVALDASTPWSRAACFGQAWARQWIDAPRKPRVLWIGRTSGEQAKLPPPFDQMGPSLSGIETELTDGSPSRELPHVHVEKDAVTLLAGGEPERRQGDLTALQTWVGQAARDGMHLSASPDAAPSRVMAFAQLASQGRPVERGFRSPEQVAEWKAVIASIGTVGIPSGGGGPPRQKQPVRLETLRVNGRLPAEVVRRIIQRNVPRLRACYEAALNRNTKLAGKLTVRLTIDRRGAVAEASDAGNDVRDAQLVGCVLDSFRKMKFPEPAEGTVVVTVPVSFGAE